MFYNAENLFDIIDDTITDDNEFLPSSAKKWTSYRYSDKIHKIEKVIIAIGGYNPPGIIGLCEIENKTVLNALAIESNLAKFPYGIIHKDSPDSRGIDVALLYRKDKIKKLGEEFITVPFSDHKTTRDILYFKALLRKDSLHIFVNHWPSRYGGQQQSEQYRIIAAKALRRKIDSILSIQQTAHILIMGDFNDEPTNKSISNHLRSYKPDQNIADTALYNLAHNTEFPGTIKYKGQWYCFDQIIISGSLLDNKLPDTDRTMHIFSASYLLEEDIKFPGKRPFRTYYGPYYHGGFSDHLPIYVEIAY
jgi:hypothetical protein